MKNIKFVSLGLKYRRKKSIFLILLILLTASNVNAVDVKTSIPIYDDTNRIITDSYGVKYSVQSDGLYKIVHNNKTRYFGFGITGTYNGQSFKKLSTDYVWSYNIVQTINGYNVSAKNTENSWFTNFSFNTDTKVTNTIINKYPLTIYNPTFYYLFTINNGDKIKHANINYTIQSNTQITKIGTPYLNSDSKFFINDKLIFNYEDIINSGFNITNFYIINASVLGFNSNKKIIAIGFSNGKNIAPNEKIIVDPYVTASDSLQYSDDAEVIYAGSAGDNHLMKTITLSPTVTGTIRVSYDEYSSSCVNSVIGSLYANDVHIGTDYQASCAYETKTQDISVTSLSTLKLYADITSSYHNRYVRNFRIYYTLTTPDVPTTVSHTNYHTAGSTTVSWNSANNAETYTYKIGTTSGGTDIANEVSTASLSSASFNTVIPNTYYFSVKGCNGGTCSAYSTESSFTFTNTVPTIPSISSHADYHNSGSTTSNWSASTDANGDSITYYYNVSTTSGGTDVINNASTTGTSTTSYTITLPNSYYVKVKACDPYGCSAYSTEDVFVWSNSAPTIPQISYPSNNSHLDNNTVNFTWNASTDVDGDSIAKYDFWLSNTSNFSQTINRTNISTNYINVSIPYNWTTYYVKVRSNDSYEYSSWSPVIQFTKGIAGIPFLFTPSNQSLQDIIILPYNQAFTWSNESSSQYNIQIASDLSFTNTESNINVNSNSTSLGMWVTGTHYWRVRTFDGVSTYGNWSNPYNFQLTQSSSPSSDGSTGVQGIVYETRTSGNIVIPSATIEITNLTWSSSTTSDINGYYRFTGLANNSLYSLKATAKNFNDGTVKLVTTVNGTWYIQNHYLTACTSSYTCNVNQQFIKFTIMSLWFTRYSNVQATVYKGSETTATYQENTGTDGTVNFWLIKDQPYTITFTNSTQGISETWTGTPPLYGAVTIFTSSSTSGLYTYGVDKNNVINVSILTLTINTTHAYVNISYNDSLAQTTALTFYLNQSIAGDPNNQTNLQSINAGASSQYNASFIVNGYAGKGYIASVNASHTTFGTISYAYGVQFPQLPSPLANFNSTSLLMLAVGFILFIAGIFGQTSSTQGAGIVVGLTWVFGGINIFTSNNIGTGFWLALTLATVITILMNINERSRREGLP